MISIWSAGKAVAELELQLWRGILKLVQKFVGLDEMSLISEKRLKRHKLLHLVWSCSWLSADNAPTQGQERFELFDNAAAMAQTKRV
jgi:hypothetical protein